MKYTPHNFYSSGGRESFEKADLPNFTTREAFFMTLNDSQESYVTIPSTSKIVW